MPWDQRSRRRDELPPDWPVICRDVLDRDGRLCRLTLAGCTGVASEVHHVGSRFVHSRSNLVAACGSCHGKVTAEQGHEAMRRARALTKHPVERPPGLLA